MIDSLFHITHIDNLPGVFEAGLRSRHGIEQLGIPYLDLSDPACQAWRTHRKVGDEPVDLHDYVPLFINPRNPMLYRLEKTLQEQGHDGSLAILEFSPRPAEWRSSLISDGIASSPASHLFHATDPEAQHALDWDAIRRRSWCDGPEGTGRRMMAEVLVSEVLFAFHIQRVWLQDPASRKRLERRLSARALRLCEVDSDRRLFF